MWTQQHLDEVLVTQLTCTQSIIHPISTSLVRNWCVSATVFQSLSTALVLSRLDYGNGTLIGLPIHLIRCLQSVQNAAARLIFRLRRSDHITEALISLHWLRVPERIVFKVAVHTYRALHGDAPQYLRQFTQVADIPSRQRPVFHLGRSVRSCRQTAFFTV